MLGGTVSDFDAAQPSMQTVLAREADTSTDAVYLTLNAGSVIVEAELYFGTAAGATFAVSQLLTGIFASSAALETALNIQFEEDLVGVTASVQQILVAPEYDAAEASLVGIGVGVGVGAVLLVVVVGGVVLHRMRRKTPTAAQALPAAQAAQLVPLPQQVVEGRPVSVREEGTAAAAILVDTTGDGVADSVRVDTSGDGLPDTIVSLGAPALAGEPVPGAGAAAVSLPDHRRGHGGPGDDGRRARTSAPPSRAGCRTTTRARSPTRIFRTACSRRRRAAPAHPRVVAANPEALTSTEPSYTEQRCSVM